MRKKSWLLLVFIAATPIAMAQEYPSKPVRLMVPYPPGGPVDTIARILAQHLSLGNEVIAGSGEDLAALISRELKLYAKIIESAGIQPQ